MKVSLNWLRQYLNINHDAESIQDMLTSLGLEIEGAECLQAGHNGLAGIVVGEVLTCTKHPEADRLSLCTVEINNGDPLAIVCGAPNVAAGQKVLVATPGAEVLGKDGAPFTIKKGVIRGANSEGMICAEDELGLGKSHEGILVLDPGAVPGTPAAAFLGLKEDWIFEIGLTPNRSDATNHLGVARDLYAALKVRHKEEVTLSIPDVSAFEEGPSEAVVQIFVEDAKACPRYTGLTISGIKVGPSPEWLRQALTSIGERPINNVVDATNYVLHELGQPLHAFDLKAIKGSTIRVKTLSADTPFISLDEVERKLYKEDLMICNGEQEPMCMAGVFGGMHSGVNNNTTAIFLESAYFDPGFIRRSSTRHNLRTEAARIYEKGADPEITVYALKRAAQLICELTGGHVSSPIVDEYPVPVERAKITVRFDRVNSLTGVAFTHEEIRAILVALDMEILEERGTSITVEVPGNKSDVTREVDVIEEILRVYGYDRIPEPGRMSVSVQTSVKPDVHLLREKVAGMLSARGFSEAMNLSLDQSARYENILQEVKGSLVMIQNTSNLHLDCMRPNLLPNMLDSVLRNLNRQQPDLKLFEFGKTYRKEWDKIEETNRLLLVVTGRREPESWLNSPRTEVDGYFLKSELAALLRLLRIQGWQEQEDTSGTFEVGQSWRRGASELVRFGAVASPILDALDIQQMVWVADLDWDALMKAIPKKDMETSSLLRFPTVRRDLALVVDIKQAYAEIEALAKKTEKRLLPSVELFDVYISEEHLGPGKKSCAISFRFTDPEKTLTDGEVDEVMERMIAAFTTKLGAVIRR